VTEPLVSLQQSLPLEEKVAERSRLSGLSPAKPTAVLDTYFRFAVERQEIFFRRLEGSPPPWTDDPVLSRHRFTNVYRASDRVSQYLIKRVIYSGEQSADEIFFRIILFKIFNRIGTWELLLDEFGSISWSNYAFEAVDACLTRAIASGARIYSAAYIMPSGGKQSTHRYKHSMHLRLLESMMRDRLPERLASAHSMGEAFDLIKAYPTIGDFLAYQYVTDLNYSALTGFSEMEFTVAGPGARDGISKCFSDLGGLSESEIIRLIADRQEDLFRQLGLSFKDLWGRPIQLIDAQNLFCEVSKYSRVTHPGIAGSAGRTRIKQKYSPGERLEMPWYPPKWGINDRISTCPA
jgi:hypothetical protein